jgi:hypothetical protein
MGSLASGALAYFLTGGERSRWRMPLLTGVGLSLLDSIVRHYAPASIQGYLGEYPSPAGLLNGWDDGTSGFGYPMLPAYEPDAAGDFTVREAAAGFDNYVAAPVDGTADDLPPGVGAYVPQPGGVSGMGTYVPDGTGDWEDGVSGRGEHGARARGRRPYPALRLEQHRQSCADEHADRRSAFVGPDVRRHGDAGVPVFPGISVCRHVCRRRVPALLHADDR